MNMNISKAWKSWTFLFMSDEGKPESSCSNKQYLKVSGAFIPWKSWTSLKSEKWKDAGSLPFTNVSAHLLLGHSSETLPSPATKLEKSWKKIGKKIEKKTWSLLAGFAFSCNKVGNIFQEKFSAIGIFSMSITLRNSTTDVLFRLCSIQIDFFYFIKRLQKIDTLFKSN